jgi:hypothetical protein
LTEFPGTLKKPAINQNLSFVYGYKIFRTRNHPGRPVKG